MPNELMGENMGKGIFTCVAMNFRDSTILVAWEMAEALSSYDLLS